MIDVLAITGVVAGAAAIVTVLVSGRVRAEREGRERGAVSTRLDVIETQLAHVASIDASLGAIREALVRYEGRLDRLGDQIDALGRERRS